VQQSRVLCLSNINVAKSVYDKNQTEAKPYMPLSINTDTEERPGGNHLHLEADGKQICLVDPTGADCNLHTIHQNLHSLYQNSMRRQQDAAFEAPPIIKNIATKSSYNKRYSHDISAGYTFALLNTLLLSPSSLSPLPGDPRKNLCL